MKDNKTIVLAMETSCDETSVAVVAEGRQILANVISSQIPLHQKYGGVVPEIASRRHIENVLPVLEEALLTAGISLEDVDAVGVTYGPGLVGALLVGVAAAKALSFALDIPLIGVNHLEGHIFANFLAHPNLEPPFLALVVSGGHTSLVSVEDYNSFRMMGQTRDDAAGEAFDKIARVLKLPYPGGPEIEKLARQGNGAAISFPRALSHSGWEFSFSGLKSSVINYIHNLEQRGDELNLPDLAASFQAAVVDVLVTKTAQAAETLGVENVVLAGGVAANGFLRGELAGRLAESQRKLLYPSPVLCTDNGAMIACRAYYQHVAGLHSDLRLNAVPALSLGALSGEKR